MFFLRGADMLDLLSKSLVVRQHFAQLNEGADNGDIHLRPSAEI
jgi:hypothetical protein